MGIEMQPKDVDEVLFNALLDTCCRLKDLTRLEATVQRMRDLKVKPSPVTLGILVKTYGQAGDLQKVLQVWSEMEKQRGQANAVTYGCMIDACVKCGHLEKAVEIFKGMREVGKHRNTILYTTLIKGYGLEKDLKSAMELFREMPHEDVPYNTITYNSIIDACIKCGDLPQAEQLLREMAAPESKLEPDLITFSTLLKGYCHVGDIDKALRVAEAIKERGLRKDELVYNTLMDGCVKANDITAGVGLFEEMVQQGMRPSAITHSILVRLYQRAGYEEDATEAVAQLYQHHGIDRPNANDRGKSLAKKTWGSTKSPPGSAGRPGGHQSPVASPSASQHSFPDHRDRSDTWSVGSWGDAPSVPSLPTFGESGVSAEPSAANTPMGSPVAHGNGGVYLPLEALRPCQVQTMPGPVAGTYVTATPTHCMPDQHQITAFGMPASPCVQPVGSPMACVAHAIPTWQVATAPHFACGIQIQNGSLTPCTPVQGQSMGDGTLHFAGMQPQAVMQMQMQPATFAVQNQANGGCQVMCATQEMMQTASLCNQGVMQNASFPMPPLPHDIVHSRFPAQQAYYENWGGEGHTTPVANMTGGPVQLIGFPAVNSS